jgi:hypothetical protein
MGATPRCQPSTPAVTLPHVRDGLSVLWMAVLCPFCKPSMGCPGHRECLRNALRNLNPIVSATTCRQKNDVETYRTNRAMTLLTSLAWNTQEGTERA